MTLIDKPGEGSLARAQAEAAAWIALLHSPERNAEIEAGLKRWIEASPLHAAAWEAASDIWNETSNLPRRIPSPQTAAHRPARAPYFRPALAMAVVLCLACGGFAAKYFLHPRVNTVVGEQRTLNLEDGTRVELNTDSHLVVKYDSRFRTVVLTSGEAYFQVAHESRPFVVVAGERRILALGTAFTVRRDDSAENPLTVTLIEGRVAVEPVEITDVQAPPPKAEILSPGERLRVHRHAPPTLDSPSIDKVTGWMRGQLIFDHTPLLEAIAEFNRYSPSKIAVASQQVGAIPVGGIFRISDSKSFARAVAETYNLHLTIDGSEIVLSGEVPPQPAP
ncbi:MAG TPA: FecR domain-containing protein [Steroidobacteraceae bacterium]